MKPALAGPRDALLGADLVMHHQIAAVADAPAARDGTQAEIVLLPAEEQRLIVAAGILPGSAANGMARPDERHRGETLSRARQQRQWIAPRRQIVRAGRMHQDAAAGRGEFWAGVQHR